MNGFPLTICKQPSGDSFWIHVEPGYRVSTCKQKIQRMRGIPGNNIRLSVPNDDRGNSSERSESNHNDHSSNSSSVGGDGFQQRTLESLGLVGKKDYESDEQEPTLNIAPISLYIRTPTGRQIKFKDIIDVEASVDSVEELVAVELESLRLLESSSVSTSGSEKRFRLYHGRVLMRKGTKITKYKIKHLDVLRLKFGTDDHDSNQKQERRKTFRKSDAYQKLESRRRNGAIKKSESADNLRHQSRSPHNRALSSSPVRAGISRDATPRRRIANRSNSENDALKQSGQQPQQQQLRKAIRRCSSEANLNEQAQPSMNKRASSASPLRAGRQEEHALRRKLKSRSTPLKTRRASRSPRRRSGSIGSKKTLGDKSERRRSSSRKKTAEEHGNKNTEGKMRSRSSNAAEGSNGAPSKKETEEGSTNWQRRSRSSSNGKRAPRKINRSRSRGGSDKSIVRDKHLEPRRRIIRSSSLKKNDEKKPVERRTRRSYSSSKNNTTQEETAKPARRRNSRSGVNKNEVSNRKPSPHRSNKNEANAETPVRKNVTSPRRSPHRTVKKALQGDSSQRRSPHRSNKNENQGEASRRSPHRSNNRNEAPVVENSSRMRSPHRSNNKNEALVAEKSSRMRSRSGPRRNPSFAKSKPQKSNSIEDAKKRIEEGHQRKTNKERMPIPNLPAETKGAKHNSIPSLIALTIPQDEDTKLEDFEEEEKKISPPSPVSVLVEAMNMSHLADDCSDGSSDIQSHETELSIYGNSNSEDDSMDNTAEHKWRKCLKNRKEKNDKDTTKESNISSKPRRPTLKELKERGGSAGKAVDPANLPPTKHPSFNTADFNTDSDDGTATTVDHAGNIVVRNTKANGTATTVDHAGNIVVINPKTNKPIARGRRPTLKEPKERGNGNNNDNAKAKEQSPVVSQSVTTKPQSFCTADFTSSSEGGSSVGTNGNLSAGNLTATVVESTPITTKPKTETTSDSPSNSVVSLAKAKFERANLAPQPTEPERQHKRLGSAGIAATKHKPKTAKDVSSEKTVSEDGAAETQPKRHSAVSLAKAKFEKAGPAQQPNEAKRQNNDEKKPNVSGAVASRPKKEIADDSVRLAKAKHEKTDSAPQVAKPTKPHKEERRPKSPEVVTTEPKVEIAKDSTSDTTASEGESGSSWAKRQSLVSRAKAMFERRPQLTEPKKHQKEEKRPKSPDTLQEGKDSSSTRNSLIDGDKVKNVVTENNSKGVPASKPQAPTTPTKRRRKRRHSMGMPDPVLNELKESLHGKSDDNPTDKDANEASTGSLVESRSKIFQGPAGKMIRPLRPSLKDTPSVRASNGSSFAQAAAEATKKLDISIINEIAIEESRIENVTEAEEATKEKPVEPPQDKTAKVTNRKSLKPLRPSFKDTRAIRVSNGSSFAKAAAEATSILDESISLEMALQLPGSGTPTESPCSSKGSIKDRIRKFQTSGKENAQTKSPVPGPVNGNRKSMKDRIQKFQTTGKENTNGNTDASGFQMIGLQTLGLVSKNNSLAGSAEEKKDCDSVSTTYSFFCSNDEDSEHESTDYSDSSYMSDDSSMNDQIDSIHVIGPDLVPIEIELKSDSEKISNIKDTIAEASGIPVDELRLVVQSEASDIEESHRNTLDDDYKLSPGEILAVQPSTVVVKLPDGNSKLELSVFPGTIMSDIKEYISSSTGTVPSRQLLYDFEKNFNEELEDETPIVSDCILRLTVY